MRLLQHNRVKIFSDLLFLIPSLNILVTNVEAEDSKTLLKLSGRSSKIKNNNIKDPLELYIKIGINNNLGCTIKIYKVT